MLGDFNIAPTDEDVYDPKKWQGRVLCSQPERQAFNQLLALGLIDCYRLHTKTSHHYTWWDYRRRSLDLSKGLRIDHILTSTAFARHCTQCWIDTTLRTEERPSDHAPVIARFKLKSSLT